jgi:alkylation response protein AidB-like acyl-CoA dehydrogenase
MTFGESQERQALRAAVRDLGGKYGREYYMSRARGGGKMTELWSEAGSLGYLGVHIPAEHGGGGGGIGDLAAVLEELATGGLPPADDGRVARDLRHGHLSFRHRGPEGEMVARSV